MINLPKFLIVPIGALLLLVPFAACTTQSDDPELTRLNRSIEELERNIANTEEALKTAPSENTTQLQNDRELAKSRLERLKERVKAKGKSH